MPVSSRSTEGRQFVELGRLLVDGALLVGLDLADFVDRAAEHVHDAAQRAGADRNGDRVARGIDCHAAAQAVGGTHGDGAHHAVAELLLHFEGQPCFSSGCTRVCQLQGFVHLGHLVARKFDVDHGTDTLNDLSLIHFMIPRLN
jgi:hypothetical protein